MKRIGVTGGTGFIGQYMIKEFGSDYDFVVATSRTDYSLLAPHAHYVYCEYNSSGFQEVFKNCDAVIHLGGHVMHGMDSDVNVTPYLPNIELANDVFMACKNLGITNIVNASSVAVYEQINEIPVREDGALYPNSVYGITKIAIEKLAELYNRRYGLRIKSLRYGQGIGFSQNKKMDRFWSILLNNCIENEPIPIWGRGITGRDVIYVKDMGYAAICAINHPEKSGEFNIGTQYIATNLEIAETYCKVFDNEQGVEFVPHTKETGIRTCMDCTKARNELGFVPRYKSLQSMIEDIKKEHSASNNPIGVIESEYKVQI